jgi:multiple sugar transport system permease protein
VGVDGVPSTPTLLVAEVEIAMRGLHGIRAREARAFYLCIALWGIGFLVFTAGPILASIYYSFTSFDIVSAPVFVGLQNFRDVFSDPLFYKSMANTLYFVVLVVPLTMILSFALALLLNQKVRALPVFRTVFYIPSIVPFVASAILWMWLLQPQYGLINSIIEYFGLNGPTWLASETWAKPALVIMLLWGSGSTMLIYLAGLQGVPESLLEAAEIDGANTWQRFVHITLPMLTPTIFFTLTMGIISAFQVFSIVYVMTSGMGGPQNATLVYLLYMFRQAFVFFRMGYASAMALILFVIVLLVTIVQFALAPIWVYYEVERR